jgi:phospholipid/cholesterol/gamma-HCH transport system substrate-binding protein
VTTRQTQIRVGIFAVVALGLGALVLVTFGGLHFLQHKNHYTVEFSDSVLGLDSGAGVYFNGIEVGSVDKIYVAPDDVSKVRVAISVKTDTPVHTDTLAFISMAGITGLKTIDLKGGAKTTPLLASGGELEPGQGTFDKLEKKAEQLADESGKLMTRASQIVDGAQQVMVNLVAATDPKPIAAITRETEVASRTLADTAHSMQAMVAENRASLHQSLDSLATASKSASDLMSNQVAGLVGSANDLMVDLRGIVHGNQTEMQAAMVDLRQASRSFKELAREVRDRPSRLLFSSAPQERKLP